MQYFEWKLLAGVIMMQKLGEPQEHPTRIGWCCFLCSSTLWKTLHFATRKIIKIDIWFLITSQDLELVMSLLNQYTALCNNLAGSWREKVFPNGISWSRSSLWSSVDPWAPAWGHQKFTLVMGNSNVHYGEAILSIKPTEAEVPPGSVSGLLLYLLFSVDIHILNEGGGQSVNYGRVVQDDRIKAW